MRPTNENSYIIRRFPVVNGCVSFDGVLYEHKKFARLYEHELELRHLQNDHIPHDEWDKDFPWEPKIASVCRIENLCGQEKEFAKCQLVSVQGHVRITTERTLQNGKPKSKGSLLRRSKQNWCDEYKRSQGCICSICNVTYDEEPLKFLHFDHIDIHTKIASISTMIVDKKYTLDMLIEESKKCRLVCATCHSLITSDQAKSGAFNLKRIISNSKKME